MLQDKKFFKFFWFFTRLCGLQSHKLNWKGKVGAIALFVVLYIVSFSLLILEMITTDSLEDRIKGLQTVPTFIIMFIDSLNFERKSKQIERLFNVLDDFIEDSGDKRLFEKYYKSTMRIIKCISVFVCFSITSNIILFLITGRSAIPIYTPKHRILFCLIWLIQSTFACYSATLLWLLDGFMFISLNILNGYTKVLSQKFEKIYVDKKSLVDCLDNHLKFKRAINEFESSFAIVIMVRTISTVITVASVTLELVNEGITIKTLAVLFFVWGTMMRLLLICHYGNEIEFNSQSFLRNTLDSHWIDFDKKRQSDLVIMQEYLKNQDSVQVAGFIHINMDIFLRVMRSAYSMLAVLRQIKK